MRSRDCLMGISIKICRFDNIFAQVLKKHELASIASISHIGEQSSVTFIGTLKTGKVQAGRLN